MRASSALWVLVLVQGLCGCAGNKVLRQAEALAERGRYTEAMGIYRQELARAPGNAKLKQRLEETKQQESRRLSAMGDVRLQAQDPARAFELYGDSTRYDPHNEEAAAGLAQARDQWLELALSAEQQGRVNEAMTIHERILREFPGFTSSTDSLARIHLAQAEALRAAAQRFLEQDMPGNALIEMLKARRSLPDDPTLRDQIRAAVLVLREHASYDVLLSTARKAPLNAPAWREGLVAQIKQQHLAIGVPGEAAGEIELQLELNGGFSKLVQKTRNVNLKLEVPDGVARRPNPEYQALKVKVDAAEALARSLELPVHEAQVQLDALTQDRIRQGGGKATAAEESQRRLISELNKPVKAASDEHQKLSQQIARMPEHFEEATTRAEYFSARETTLRVAFSGDISLRGPKAELLERIPLQDAIEVQDQFHPALPATKTRPEVRANALELPPEDALRAILQERLLALVASRCKQQYNEYVTQRWGEARRLAVAGKTEEAVETFLEAYLADPGRPSDEAFRYILDTKRVPGLPLLETLKDPPAPSQTARQE